MRVKLPTMVRHKINTNAREITEFEEKEIIHYFSFFKHSKINGKVYGRRHVLEGPTLDKWVEKKMTDTYLEQVFYGKKVEDGECDGREFLEQIAKKPGRYFAIRMGKFKQPGKREVVSADCQLLRMQMDQDELKIRSTDTIPETIPATIPNHAKIDSCAFSSLASALLALHDVKASNLIIANIKKSLTQDPFEFAVKLLRTHQLKYSPTMRYHGSFNILVNRFPFPTMCQLMDSNGRADHSVTVIGDIIYDFNYERPLPLTKESLDECCRTRHGDLETTFVTVTRACYFNHPKPPRCFELNANYM